MELSVNTKSFLSEFVFPHFVNSDLNSKNIDEIIDYIVENYEKPLSLSIADGEFVDLENFENIGNVILDLSSYARSLKSI
ncbi:MAG: hypothetical protein IJ656_00915 [Bacilli bacterium]|nr:hypothetical protein [Bacilli bacterium]